MTVLAFRIFVMLSCLIIVPMAAIFGSAFPDVVKSVLVDRIVAWSTGKSPETNRDPAAGGFSEVTPAGGQATRAGAAEWEAPRWGGSQGNENASWQSPENVANSNQVVPVGGESASSGNPASLTVPAEPQHGNPAVAFADHGGDPAARNAGADARPLQKRPFAPPTGAPPAGYDGDASAQPARSLEEPERFTSMERKLREYGATYYLLETWGQEGELYRFHCKMAVGNNPNYTRHFEATDRDALKAMAQVLSRVEAWRAGRLQ